MKPIAALLFAGASSVQGAGDDSTDSLFTRVKDCGYLCNSKSKVVWSIKASDVYGVYDESTYQFGTPAAAFLTAAADRDDNDDAIVSTGGLFSDDAKSRFGEINLNNMYCDGNDLTYVDFYLKPGTIRYKLRELDLFRTGACTDYIQWAALDANLSVTEYDQGADGEEGIMYIAYNSNPDLDLEANWDNDSEYHPPRGPAAGETRDNSAMEPWGFKYNLSYNPYKCFDQVSLNAMAPAVPGEGFVMSHYNVDQTVDFKSLERGQVEGEKVGLETYKINMKCEFKDSYDVTSTITGLKHDETDLGASTEFNFDNLFEIHFFEDDTFTAERDTDNGDPIIANSPTYVGFRKNDLNRLNNAIFNWIPVKCTISSSPNSFEFWKWDFDYGSESVDGTSCGYHNTLGFTLQKGTINDEFSYGWEASYMMHYYAFVLGNMDSAMYELTCTIQVCRKEDVNSICEQTRIKCGGSPS